MMKRRRAGKDARSRRLLAAAIVARRAELGMTQMALAEKSGISLRSVQNLEAAKHMPQPVTFARLARALEMETADLRRIAGAGSLNGNGEAA